MIVKQLKLNEAIEALKAIRPTNINDDWSRDQIKDVILEVAEATFPAAEVLISPATLTLLLDGSPYLVRREGPYKKVSYQFNRDKYKPLPDGKGFAIPELNKEIEKGVV